MELFKQLVLCRCLAIIHIFENGRYGNQIQEKVIQVYDIALSVAACVRSGTRADVAWMVVELWASRTAENFLLGVVVWCQASTSDRLLEVL